MLPLISVTPCFLLVISNVSCLAFSSPTSISDHNAKVPKSFYFGSDPSGNWEASTTLTTLTAPRSQRSTLQRDQVAKSPQTPDSPKPPPRRHEENNKRFSSHEKYFEHKAYVFGHKYSSRFLATGIESYKAFSLGHRYLTIPGSREMMWPGKHSFPFSYCLPSKLPASFHGRFGYVRYFCEASLERHNSATIQRRAFFNVSTVMDLNTDSKADVSCIFLSFFIASVFTKPLVSYKKVPRQ